jgi:hypothetical protein
MSLLTKVVWMKRPKLTKIVMSPSPKITASPTFFRREFTLSSFNKGIGYRTSKPRTKRQPLPLLPYILGSNILNTSELKFKDQFNLMSSIDMKAWQCSSSVSSQFIEGSGPHQKVSQKKVTSEKEAVRPARAYRRVRIPGCVQGTRLK